jgi:hypothetical protein
MLMGVSVFAQHHDTIMVETVTIDTVSSFVTVPIWAITQDTFCSYMIPLTWECQRIGFAGLDYNYWPGCYPERYDTVIIDTNFVRVKAWCEEGAFLPVRQVGWRLMFYIEPDAPPQVVSIDTTVDEIDGPLLFGACDGMTEIHPVFVSGGINYLPTKAIDYTAQSKDHLFVRSYPNPWGSMTQIAFTISKAGGVRVGIYNILGQNLVEYMGYFEAGYHSLSWDSRDRDGNLVPPSGVYFLRIETEDKVETRKMTQVR